MGNETSIPERPFLSPDFVEAKVNGRLVRFYSIHLRAAYRLKALGKPLAGALASLFGASGHGGVTKRTFANALTGETGTETVIPALDLKVADALTKAHATSIETLVGVLLEESNALVFGELLMDSMRDEFSRPIQRDAVQAFIDDVDMKTLLQMFSGFADANKDSFDPLVARLFTIRGDANSPTEAVEEAAAPVETPSPTPT